MKFRIPAVLAVTVLTGCGDRRPEPDAPPPRIVDAQLDAPPHDAGADAPPDAPPDSPLG